MNHTAEYSVDREDGEIYLDIEFTTSRYYAARTYGLPENCYPAEGGEIEDITAYADGAEFELTAAETAKLKTWLYNNEMGN